jgi:hypothetical protein
MGVRMTDHVRLAGENEYLKLFAVRIRGEKTDCEKWKQEGDAELVQNCIFHEGIVWGDLSGRTPVAVMASEIDIKNKLQLIIRFKH